MCPEVPNDRTASGRILLNVGMLPPHCMALHPKRLDSSNSQQSYKQAMLVATQYGTTRLPSKKVIVKIYKSIILPVLPGRGTLLLTLTLERTHTEGVTKWQTGCRKLHTYLHDGYSVRTRSIGIGVSACRNNLVDLSVNKIDLKYGVWMRTELFRLL